MKHQVRTIACGAALAAAVGFMIAGCGGKQTMASKSAAAYDEAREKGIPMSAGEHGGHAEVPAAESAATSVTQSAMPGMDHSQMSGMNHTQMPGMQHGGATTAEHDMTGMEHGSMAGMDHSRMTGMEHSSMAGMDHSTMSGMQHAPPAAPVGSTPPRTNTAIAQTPADTLKADALDTAVPTSVNEAAKAGSQQHQHAPQSQPPVEHHEGHRR
jgi:uncharacterized protein involved in copper resistance